MSIWFFVWVFCPSVVSLFFFFLAAVVGNCPLLLVAAVGVSLLMPCDFCPPWGVSGLAVAVGVGVFLIGVLGLLPALGCLLSFGGCDWRLSFWRSGTFAPPVVFVFLPWVAVVWGWCLSFGSLELPPALGCLSSLWWLWLARWGFCLLCCVSFPSWLLWWAFVLRCGFLVGSVCSAHFVLL